MIDNSILWLIPAREGSKSIKNKNIKLLNGTPLIEYRIKSALCVSKKENVWVSTDSEQYASIARKAGATVPFIRPKKLSTDTASSVDVVLHAMEHAKKFNKEFDYVGLLQPTSPFITSNQLNEAMALIEKNKEALAVVAVRETRPNKIFIQKESMFLKELFENLKNLKRVRRQEFEKEITPSGGFFISKWNAFIKKKSFYTTKTLSFKVDEISGLDIDEPIDWEFAEFIIRKLNK